MLVQDAVEHRVAGRQAPVHQLLDVAGDAARERPEGEQVVGRPRGVVIREDPPQDGELERLDAQPGRGASVEGLAFVEEDAVHERVHAAADDEVHLRRGVVPVPVLLDFAEDARGDLPELLQFVHDERERSPERFLDERPEELAEPEARPVDRDREDLLRPRKEVGALVRLRAPRDEPVDRQPALGRAPDKLRLANAPPSRDHGEPSPFRGTLPFAAQKRDFLFPVVEVHLLPRLSATSVSETAVAE